MAPAPQPGPGVPEPALGVRAARDAPSESFVRVRYENHWFWIENDDRRSKLTFAFLRMLFSTIETGAEPPPTLVTVPG